jgi:hypothetical protein
LFEQIVEIGETLLLDVESGDEGGVGMIDAFAVFARLFPIIAVV